MGSKPVDLELLMHIPLRLTAELGSATMSVGQLLELGNGSVLELDRPADAPVDVLVNSRPVAHGEIVAVDHNFGVRITGLIGRE
jgi:flagellar motor switch protein FliN